jgi:hypothetical protein
LAELLDIFPSGAVLVTMHPPIDHIAGVKITMIVTTTAMVHAPLFPKCISKFISAVNAYKILAGEVFSH